MPNHAASPSRRPAASMILPLAALFGAIVSLCVGTSFAKQLFPVLGPEGVTALRVTLAAVMLVA